MTPLDLTLARLKAAIDPNPPLLAPLPAYQAPPMPPRPGTPAPTYPPPDVKRVQPAPVPSPPPALRPAQAVLDRQRQAAAGATARPAAGVQFAPEAALSARVEQAYPPGTPAGRRFDAFARSLHQVPMTAAPTDLTGPDFAPVGAGAAENPRAAVWRHLPPRPDGALTDPIAWRLFRGMNAGLDVPMAAAPARSGVVPRMVPPADPARRGFEFRREYRPEYAVTIGAADPTGLNVPAGLAAVHEANHVKQLRPELAPTEMWPAGIAPFKRTAELTPSLADVPVGLEYLRRAGLPAPSAPLTFGPGKQMAPEAVRAIAERHGLYKGKAMAELLNTTVGQQWLRQAVDGMPAEKGGAAVDVVSKAVKAHPVVNASNYGQVYVNDELKKVWVVTGDWNEKADYADTVKAVGKAAPGYEVVVEAEVPPPRDDRNWRKVAQYVPPGATATPVVPPAKAWDVFNKQPPTNIIAPPTPPTAPTPPKPTVVGTANQAEAGLQAHVRGLPAPRQANVTAMTSHLHGAAGPRAAVAVNKFTLPGGRPLVPYGKLEADPVGNQMYQQMYGHLATPAFNQTTESRGQVGRTVVPGKGLYLTPAVGTVPSAAAWAADPRPFVPALTKIHETAHLAQNPERADPATVGRDIDRAQMMVGGDPTKTVLLDELAPSLADIPVGAEYLNRWAAQHNAPAPFSPFAKQVTTPLAPGAAPQNVEWMRQQAERHGLFKGVPMSQLLNTNAGRAWLNQVSQPATQKKAGCGNTEGGKMTDRLPGGAADAIPPAAFSAADVAKGKKVEAEHTSDPAVVAEIARDHLAEFPHLPAGRRYYDRLAEMESDMKAQVARNEAKQAALAGALPKPPTTMLPANPGGLEVPEDRDNYPQYRTPSTTVPPRTLGGLPGSELIGGPSAATPPAALTRAKLPLLKPAAARTLREVVLATSRVVQLNKEAGGMAYPKALKLPALPTISAPGAATATGGAVDPTSADPPAKPAEPATKVKAAAPGAAAPGAAAPGALGLPDYIPGQETIANAVGNAAGGGAVNATLDRLSKFRTDNPWVDWGLGGAALGGGIGLLSGALGRKRNRRNALGDMLSGAVMGGLGGGLGRYAFPHLRDALGFGKAPGKPAPLETQAPPTVGVAKDVGFDDALMTGSEKALTTAGSAGKELLQGRPLAAAEALVPSTETMKRLTASKDQLQADRNLADLSSSVGHARDLLLRASPSASAAKALAASTGLGDDPTRLREAAKALAGQMQDYSRQRLATAAAAGPLAGLASANTGALAENLAGLASPDKLLPAEAQGTSNPLLMPAAQRALQNFGVFNVAPRLALAASGANTDAAVLRRAAGGLTGADEATRAMLANDPAFTRAVAGRGAGLDADAVAKAIRGGKHPAEVADAVRALSKAKEPGLLSAVFSGWKPSDLVKFPEPSLPPGPRASWPKPGQPNFFSEPPSASPPANTPDVPSAATRKKFQSPLGRWLAPSFKRNPVYAGGRLFGPQLAGLGYSLHGTPTTTTEDLLRGLNR